MTTVNVKCQNERCGTEFSARKADVKRGWAKCCSKRCAAIVREKKTGNYKRFKQLEQARERSAAGCGGSFFMNAHQFDNCEI